MRRTVFAAAAAFAFAASASAQERSVYVGVFGGGDFVEDESINGANAAGAVRDIDVEFDTGSVFGAVVGVAGAEQSWGRIRGEVEASFREADMSALALNGVARQFNPASEVSVSSALVNAYYDSPLYADRVRFFAGAGFGIAGIDHEIRYLVANAAATGGNLQILIPTTETTFAYQLIGGAEVELGGNWSLIGDVRYFDLGDVQVERFIANSIIDGTATNNGTLDSVLDADWSTISATVGLRYRF